MLCVVDEYVVNGMLRRTTRTPSDDVNHCFTVPHSSSGHRQGTTGDVSQQILIAHQVATESATAAAITPHTDSIQFISQTDARGAFAGACASPPSPPSRGGDKSRHGIDNEKFVINDDRSPIASRAATFIKDDGRNIMIKSSR